jgi:hypothetical protein
LGRATVAEPNLFLAFLATATTPASTFGSDTVLTFLMGATVVASTFGLTSLLPNLEVEVPMEADRPNPMTGPLQLAVATEGLGVRTIR